MNVRQQRWADLSLLLVTLVWGGTFVMVKGATETFPVWAFLALRFGLAALVLLPFGWQRLRRLGWRGWGAGALIGLALLAGYAFQTLGLQYTTASKAGFITGLSVAIVPLLSALLLRQRPKYAALVGVALAVVGLALLSLTNGGETTGELQRISEGDVLVLLCAVSFALHIVAVGALGSRHDYLALTIVQVFTVALLSGVVSLFVDLPWPALQANTLFAAAFTGVLATAVAFLVQTAMQRFTTPTHTALIFTAEPVFAALFGVLLAGDVMTPLGLMGGVLILLGTLISELPWDQRAARLISRFLAPHYVSIVILLALGLLDPHGWWYGLAWVVGLALPVVGLALLVLKRALRQGRISDWHITERTERLQWRLVASSLGLSLLPVLVLALLDGPRYLLMAFGATLVLVLINTAITVWWKVSQHVSGIALGATLITGVVGPTLIPVLLLIPLVAWARVRGEAHTVPQTIAGGTIGVGVALLALRLFGLV
jgi:drug/metabolite transporter (DMT)-like permease